MAYYLHPQETWDEAKCEKIAKRYTRDGMGTKHPRPGYIGSSASMPAAYGRTKYNGGTTVNGQWYEGIEIPFPNIPDNYEIIRVPTWGWYLRKKDQTVKKSRTRHNHAPAVYPQT